MQGLSTAEKIGFVAKKVLTSPISILLWIVGGALTFTVLKSVPLFLPILAMLGAQAALIFRALQDENYLRKLFEDRANQADSMSADQIESLLESMDFETRQRIRYVLQLQKEIVKEAKAPDVQSFAKPNLEQIANQITPLVAQAVRIGTKKQQLAKYLNNVDERALKGYCNSLRQKIDATTDSVTKSQYEQALRAREAELQTYQAILQATTRIDSQLESVEATFASWKAKVIRIKTADMASATSASAGLQQELELLNTDIQLLDKSVNEALLNESAV